MAAYHKAAYTLEPETLIADEVPLAAGHTEAEADAIVALSAGYSPESKITAAVVPTGLQVQITLTPATPLKAGFRITWTWGDGLGRIERAPDLVQTYTYTKAGRYRVVAYIFQPGLPTLDIEIPVTV